MLSICGLESKIKYQWMPGFKHLNHWSVSYPNVCVSSPSMLWQLCCIHGMKTTQWNSLMGLEFIIVRSYYHISDKPFYNLVLPALSFIAWNNKSPGGKGCIYPATYGEHVVRGQSHYTCHRPLGVVIISEIQKGTVKSLSATKQLFI